MTQYLSLRRAAEQLGVHHATLSRAVKRGELSPEYRTPGGFMRFTEAEIERFRYERLKHNGKLGLTELGPDVSAPRYSAGLPDNVNRILDSIPELACQLVRAEFAALAIYGSEGEIVRFVTAGVSEEQRKKIGSPPTGKGLLGIIQSDGQPIRIPDISKDPRSVGFPLHHPAMKALLGVPIMVNGKSIGNLYLTNKVSGEEFTERDEQIVETFSRYASSAIESAHLYAREAHLRRHAEQERARLHAIIESSAAAVVVAEAKEGKVILANKEAARMLGVELLPGEKRETYERAAIFRKPDGTLYAPDELPLQRALSEGVTLRGVEVEFNFPDGRKIPTVVNAAPVRDDGGKITAAIAVFEDVTQLQEVERLKAEFLSMITHDLRSPLATIKGLSSSVLMDNGPRDLDTLLEYMTSIDEETDRTTELVGNLLDMSRIEANAMPMDPELCHLADIIAETVRRAEGSRLGGKHKVTVNVPLDLPEIYADYDQIARVISNLLSNAMKYSPEGSKIDIKSYLDPNDSSVIITEVADEGDGIPEGEIGKIFDKFYRVTAQLSRRRPGSGLGLAICKAIVQAHDGEIWVESEVGVGSRFFFSLPGAVASVGYD